RELSAPSRWYGNRENSGLALHLVWRVGSQTGTDVNAWRYAYIGGGMPAWLDLDRMRALGFDAPASLDAARARSRYEKQLPREVMLVLELDGPAYRRSLELAAEHVARAEAKPAAQDDKGRAAQLKNAREALELETTRNSR